MLFERVHFLIIFKIQAGTPEVFATGDYDAGSKTYKLTLRQSSKKEGTLPFHIPVVVGLLLKEDGSEVRRLCFTLQFSSEPFLSLLSLLIRSVISRRYQFFVS